MTQLIKLLTYKQVILKFLVNAFELSVASNYNKEKKFLRKQINFYTTFCHYFKMNIIHIIEHYILKI